MSEQLGLFPNSYVDEAFLTNIKRHRYPLEEVDIGDITFRTGQRESVHRWYRLTPSFAPSVVRYLSSVLEVTPESFVFDPFAGRGTTIIECQKHGIPAIGFEINPLLQQVGDFSLRWHPLASPLFSAYLHELDERITAYRTLDIEDVLKVINSSIPSIHNVYRWWRPAVLKELIIARELSRAADYEQIHHFLWLAINSAALECANVHRNHPTITFDDGNTRDINVFETVRARVREIEEDLDSLRREKATHSRLGTVALENSCEPIRLGDAGAAQATHVITSPPYPNRFSYIHQTRPQLHFMEVIKDRSEATEIDLKSIGGTWGRATSNLQKAFLPPPKELQNTLDYIEVLKPKNLLMCNYATKYFIDLNTHIQRLKDVAANGFRGAYVVGNSRLSGVEIFTEIILARLFELNGFTVEGLILFRKRGGRKRLYESAVRVKA